MLKIEGKTISVNRGDDNVSFDLKIPINGTDYYTFTTSDTIRFGLYDKKALDKNAVLLKEITPQEETTVLTISFTKEELTIGDLSNKEKTYWYEIQLNDNTIIGYDKEGAKEFILYPEGSDVE